MNTKPSDSAIARAFWLEFELASHHTEWWKLKADIVGCAAAYDADLQKSDAELTTEHARVLQDIPKPDDPGGRENGVEVSDSAARALYERWVDEQDIHCNRFKSWGEMTDKAKQEWRDKAVQANTGNPEIDRVIGRLMSSDPDFDDCENAAALLRRLAAKPQEAGNG